MEYTETYKHMGPCSFSPNARFLAVAVDYRLVIRDVLTLKVRTLRHFQFRIVWIEFDFVNFEKYLKVSFFNLSFIRLLLACVLNLKKLAFNWLELLVCCTDEC